MKGGSLWRKEIQATQLSISGSQVRVPGSWTYCDRARYAGQTTARSAAKRWPWSVPYAGQRGLLAQLDAFSEPSGERRCAVHNERPLPIHCNHVITVIEHAGIHETAEFRLQIRSIAEAGAIIVPRMNDERWLFDRWQLALDAGDEPPHLEHHAARVGKLSHL